MMGVPHPIYDGLISTNTRARACTIIYIYDTKLCYVGMFVKPICQNYQNGKINILKFAQFDKKQYLCTRFRA